MKQTIATICLLILTLINATSLSARQKRFIHTRGKEIIGMDGKPFLLKGTNLGNWLVPEGYMFKFKNINSPRKIHEMLSELIGPDATATFWKKFMENYITEADIHYLKSIGANSIRIPFHYRLFTNEDYLGANDANRGFQMLDRVIGWCKKEGIYVILDMHCAPGGQTGDNIDDSYGYPFLFRSETSRALTVSIWKKIAAHYKNEPTIAGYDLLNEPVAHYFNAELLNPLVEPFYKTLTREIRIEDKNHIIFLGGAQWNSNFKIFGPPFDTNVVYTFHKYGDQPNLGSIQRFIDFSEKYNVPLYAGETGENTDEWITEFRKLLDKHHISWHFWPYKKMDSPKNIVSVKTPGHYDSVMVYAEKLRSNFKDIRTQAPVNRELIGQILDDILNNVLFQHCIRNNGYVEALGFKSK